MKSKAWVYFSSSGTSLICVALGCVSGILVARLLGPLRSGELSVIAYFPSVMSTFFPLAIPQALSFFISKEPHRGFEIAAAGFRLSLIVGIVGAIITAWVSRYTLTGENQYLTRSITWICLMAPAMVVNPHVYAILRGFHRFSHVNGMLIFGSCGYILLLLGLWYTQTASAFTIAFSMQCLQIVIVSLCVWFIGSSLFLTRVAWSTYKMCLLQGLRFWLPALALTLFMVSDRAILIRTTNIEQMGFYAAAFAVGFPFTLVSESFAQISFIEISGQNCHHTASDLLMRRFQMAQVAALGSVLAGLPFVHWIIKLGFGAAFAPAIAPAYFIVIAMSIRGLSGVLESGLRAKNLIWPGIAASLTSLGCLIFFAAILIPGHGVKGFGLALLLAQALGLTVLCAAAKQSLSIGFSQLYGIRPSIILAIYRNLLSLIQPKEPHANSYNATAPELLRPRDIP
jgi:O-antigen/teichoic acid export membrane protein